MMLTILQALYFFFPAYGANMTPVYAHELKLPLGYPVTTQYFGDRKTVRGIMAGIVAALGVVFVQKMLFMQGYPFFQELSLLEYSTISIILYGLAFGLGALVGDLIKSFFKRRLEREPASPWVPSV